MANIGVKPVRKGMSLAHPLDGPLADDGGVWRDDQFTLRLIRDGDLKRVEHDAANEEPSGQLLAPQPASAPTKKA